MSRKKTGSHWLIQGFSGTSKIYERRIDIGQLTIDQAKALIRPLTAKASLTFDEIVGAYATRKTRIANDHLQVDKEGPHPVFWCGDNPHFIISARGPNGVPRSQPVATLRLTRTNVN
jgi:hypothetical protein